MAQQKIQQISEDNAAQLLSRSQQIYIVQQPVPKGFYTEEPYRYINLVIFLLAAAINSIPNQTFTAINSRIVELYKVDKLVVAMNTLLFPISHPVFAFFANGILDKYGLKLGCSIGGAMMIVGCWLRYFINQSIWFTLVGSFIAAAGNIFIIDSPSKLANNWFKPQNVPFITTLGVLASLLSNSLSLVLPAFFVNTSSQKSDIKFMIMVQAIIVTIPMIILILFLRQKPKVPPSFAAAVNNKQNYIKDLKKLFASKNYLILLLIMSMSYGSLTGLLTDVQYLILPFNYINVIKFSSNLLFIASVGGTIGCVFFIRMLKITQKYKLILLICLLGTLLEIILLPFALATNIPWVSFVNIGLVGFFIIPVTPIIMQFGCQIAFPIGQASSSGFLLAGGQLFGFLVGSGFLSYLDGKTIYKVFVVCGSFSLFYLVGTIALYFMKQDLRRKKYEHLSVRMSDGMSKSNTPLFQ